MISVKIFDPPEWNVREIMRYVRVSSDDSYTKLIEECIKEAAPTLSYRVCFTYADISRGNDGLSLGSLFTASQTLQRALKDSDTALLFAATVGAPFDRLIQKYSRISPSKALIMQAIGAERVESLCDAFCGEIDGQLKSSGKSLTHRVSPGYGDISLDMQRDIFAILDCPRKIGLTLDESLLMSPSKSVTAICGVTVGCKNEKEHSCDRCSKTDCIFREKSQL